MTTPELYLLPVPNSDRAPLEPVTHLLEALEYIAKNRCTVAKDAAERRALLYDTAAANLADTYPVEQQEAVYDRHTARYPHLNATQQRTATLAMHGLATDRAANGTQHQDEHTWSAAAIAALETYRHRPTRSISERFMR